MAFADPRSCMRNFFETGRNLGRRAPSLSLRNVQRDIRSTTTRLENIGTRVEGAIGAAARGDFLPGQLFSITNEFRCPPTPHASYFGQHRQPKFKFMFFVSFDINPDFKDAFGLPWSQGEPWWFIKQSGRPNVSYEYEEVNMYNFRQKVLRRATFNPVALNMYDDMADSSAGFWNTFLRIQSPVTNLNTETLIEDTGMNWGTNAQMSEDLGQVRSDLGESADQPQMKYSASTGVLIGDGQGDEGSGIAGSGFKQILRSINVYHIIDWGKKVIRYEYINPRINEINFDELTWESSDPNVIDVNFEYDTFHIHMPQGLSEDDVNKHLPPIYPINPNQDETPIPIVNTGIDKFNKGVDAATGALAKAASNIPGFG